MARNRGFGRDRGGSPEVFGNVLSNVQGAASLKETAKYHTGPRCVIKVNNRLVGFAFSVSWNIQTENQEIRTIDDYFPVELAPSMVSVSGTLGTFVIPGRSATSELLQSNALSFMMNKYITLEISDSATGTLLFKTNKAVVTGQTTNIQADQMSVTQLNWKAIGWQHEFAPEEVGQESGGGLINYAKQVTSLFKK